MANVRRLVEAHYFENVAQPNAAQRRFWLKELRTPELLIEVTRKNMPLARRVMSGRPLLTHALNGDIKALEESLITEERAERERDRAYWLPLKKEMEALRHAM